jgi:acyl-coenzyme A thioesterase PaaI-like protein
VLLVMTIPAVDRMAIVAGRDPLEGRMRVLPHLVGPGGRPRIGALAALADSITGVHAFEVTEGDVPLTSDLAVHATGGPVAAGEELYATSEVLRRRRTGAVFGVEIRERSRPERLVGTGTVTYTLVKGLVGYRPEPRDGDWPRPDLSTSLADALPLSIGPSGNLELEIDRDTRNAVDVLSGGALLVAADLACEHAARAATGGAVEVTDLLVHFLAPGRSGPVRFEATTEVDGLQGLVRVKAVETGPDAASGPISSITGRVRLVEEVPAL